MWEERKGEKKESPEDRETKTNKLGEEKEKRQEGSLTCRCGRMASRRDTDMRLGNRCADRAAEGEWKGRV